MKAGWFFCFADYNPVTMVLQPQFPGGVAPQGAMYVLYDIRRLDNGIAPYDHVHQVIGTIGFQNDDVGDGHYHYVQYFGSSWQQFTVGAPTHTHPFTTGGVNNVRFLPDYFVVFLSAEDVEFDALVNDSKWFLIGEADVTYNAEMNTYYFGDIDNTAFTQQEFNAWSNRLRVALGRAMPSVVTNPRRLVSWFCPMAAPNMSDWWNESMFRFTGR